jgi:hypothetical protein
MFSVAKPASISPVRHSHCMLMFNGGPGCCLRSACSRCRMRRLPSFSVGDPSTVQLQKAGEIADLDMLVPRNKKTRMKNWLRASSFFVFTAKLIVS